MAELVKAAGAPLWLALPSGRYDVLLRDPSKPRLARECKVELTRGQAHGLQTAGCQEVTLPDPNQKGEEGERHEVWFLELGVSGSAQRDDGYVQTLEQFRYQRGYKVGLLGTVKPEDRLLFMETALGFAVHRNLSLLGRFDTFEKRVFHRQLSGPNWEGRKDVFDWRSQAVSLGARARLPLWQEYIVVVAELSVGLGISRSTYEADGDASKSWDFGPALRGAFGFNFGSDHFGVYLMSGYALVRSLKNEIGDTHDDGGFFGSLGLRLRSLKRWW
jgi:hypothetical protein